MMSEEQENITYLPNNDFNIPNFPHEYFNVNLRATRRFKDYDKHVAQEVSYTAVLKDPQPGQYIQDIGEELEVLFDSLLAIFKLVYRDFDLVRVFIQHQSLTSCNIIVPPTYFKDMSSQVILQEIGRIVRSNATIPADQNLEINVAAIRNVKGTSFLTITNPWVDLQKKKMYYYNTK